MNKPASSLVAAGRGRWLRDNVRWVRLLQKKAAWLNQAPFPLRGFRLFMDQSCRSYLLPGWAFESAAAHSQWQPVRGQPTPDIQAQQGTSSACSVEVQLKDQCGKRSSPNRKANSVPSGVPHGPAQMQPASPVITSRVPDRPATVVVPNSGQMIMPPEPSAPPATERPKSNQTTAYSQQGGRQRPFFPSFPVIDLAPLPEDVTLQAQASVRGWYRQRAQPITVNRVAAVTCGKPDPFMNDVCTTLKAEGRHTALTKRRCNKSPAMSARLAKPAVATRNRCTCQAASRQSHRRNRQNGYRFHDSICFGVDRDATRTVE